MTTTSPPEPGDHPDREDGAGEEAGFGGKSRRQWLVRYVLWAIGGLAPADLQALEAMTPELRALHGGESEWHEIIAAALGLSPDLEEQIQDVWNRTRQMAMPDHILLDPNLFAEMLVEANFPD